MADQVSQYGLADLITGIPDQAAPPPVAVAPTIQNDPEASLKNFYSSFTDRETMWQQLKYEKENNPVFEGLDEKQIGKVINDFTGAEEGSRFDMFDSRTRWADGLGYWVSELAGGAAITPHDLAEGYAGRSYTSAADHAGNLARAVAKFAGVKDEEDLNQWQETGKGIPSGLGLMGLAAVPYVGVPAMMSASYGKAVNDARVGGASSSKAIAVGAIDAGVGFLTFKLGSGLSDKASEVALNTFGKVAAKEVVGLGTAKALQKLSGLTAKAGVEGLSEGAPIAGRALFDYGVKAGALTGARKMAAIATREGIVEGAQSALGVGGQIVHEGILDYETLKEHMKDPTYWATTFASEGIFALLGSTIGRIREPNKLKDYEATGVVAPTEATGNIFAAAGSRADDEKLLNMSKSDKENNAAGNLKQMQQAKEGPDAVESIAQAPDKAVGVVSTALSASGKTGLNANDPQTAISIIDNKPKGVVQAVIADAAVKPIASPVPNVTIVGKVSFDNLQIQLGQNLGTVKLTRADFGKPVEEFAAKGQTPEEQVMLKQLHQKYHTRMVEERNAPESLRFDSTFDAPKQLGYKTFFAESGLQGAIDKLGIKIKFLDSTKSNDWLDRFNAHDRPAINRYNAPEGGGLWYLTASPHHRLTDIHELGHVVDFTLEAGGWGPEAQTQWADLKAKFIDPNAQNILGAAMGTKVTTPDPMAVNLKNDLMQSRITNLKEYYNRPLEWAAQAFKGYMLGKPTKFKTFMEQNFAGLHQVFESVVKSLRTLISDKTRATKDDINKAWGSGQAEANIFFEKLFMSASGATTEARAYELINKHKLTGKAAESVLEAVNESQTLAGYKATFDAIERWASEGNPVESDLLDQLEFVKLLNSASITLTDLAAPKTGSLPNVRRLQGIVPQDLTAEILLRIPEENQELAMEYIKSLKNLPVRGQRALEAIDQVLSGKIALHEKSVGPASLYDKGVLLLQVDHILGRWMRGELPEQQGKPMWDKGAVREDYFKRKQAGRELVRQPEVMDQRKIEFGKEFPLLSKYIKQIRTGERREGFVGEDGSLKDKKRLVFESLQEAQEFSDTYNNEGKFLGYTFSPKAVTRGTKDKQVIRYVVRHRMDERASLVAEYRDDLHNLSPDLMREPLVDEPDVHEHWVAEQEEVLKNSYFEDMDVHVGRITKRVFTQMRAGNMAAMPRKFKQSVLDYLKGEEANPMYGDRLKEELGITSKEPEDLLLGLYGLAQTDKVKKDELMIFLPKHITTMVENFNTSMGLWVRQDLLMIRNKVAEGQIPPVENRPDKWEMFSDGITPAEQKWFHDGVAITQLAEAGGLSRSLDRGVKYGKLSPRTLLSKGVGAIENLLVMTHGGMQTIGAKNKLFAPLAELIRNEEAQQTRDGQEMMELLRWSGKVVEIDGKREWISDGRNGRKDDSAYIAINASKRLKPVFNEIQRMQNEAGGARFDDVLKGNFEGKNEGQKNALIQKANALVGKTFDMNNPKHKVEMNQITEMLERTYAYQRKHADIVMRRENDVHKYTTANAIFRGLDFDQTPERALELATKLNDLATDQPEMRNGRLLLLTSPKEEGGMGWDMQRALSFDEKWMKTHMEVKNLNAMMKSTPGYVSEQRMRRWLVPYNEPKTDGAAVGTGLRDFDSLEEAYAFMKSAKERGITLNAKQPMDQYEKGGNYRSGVDRLEDVVNKVVSARQEMLAFALEDTVKGGGMSQEEANRMVSLMQGMSEDISADMLSSRVGAILGKQRHFKAGREELDMAYQQEESGWRTAVQYSRKITDAGYELFMHDERLAPYEYERDRFRKGKNAMRIADGRGQRIASKIAFTHFILGNISSAMVETVQWPLTLSHTLVEEGAGILEAFKTPAKMMARAASASSQRLLTGKNDSIWTGETRELIDFAIASNALGVHAMNDISSDSARQYIQLQESIANPGAFKGIKNTAATLGQATYKASNNFYAFFSRINAELSLASSYEVLRKKQYGAKQMTQSQKEQLFGEAIRVSNKANGSWGRSNRPMWFNSDTQSMRTVAQLMWSLQGFASNHVANHLRLLRESIGVQEQGLTKEQITRSRKALATLTTMQIAGLGVMGHTLSGGLSKLVQKTFGFDPETELLEFLQEDTDMEPEDALALSELIMYGAMHQGGMPIDLQSRMSVSGLGPINQFDGLNASALGGPLASATGALVDGWKSVTKGDQSFMRWSTNLLPNGLQRAVRMELFDDGKVFDKSGQFVMEPTGVEKIAAYMGFSSKRYSEKMKSSGKMFEANEADGILRQQTVNAIRKDMLDGNRFEALQRLQNEAPRLGMTVQDLAQRVADKDVQQTFGRAISEGAGPNAQRAARLFPNELPQASETEKTMRKFQTLDQLQQLPKRWKKDMFKAAMMDKVQGYYPMLNRSERQNAIRQPDIRSTILTELGGMNGVVGGLGQTAAQFGQY